MEELPYKVEYAKSSRSKCRHCKITIEKGELRLAALVQSFFHDGKDCHWFHLTCFFKKHRPQSIDDIEHFEDVRIEDQKSIREQLDATKGILLPEPKGKKKGKKRAADENEAGPSNAEMLKDFGVEYAKSSRSTCGGCGNFIMQNEVRVKKMVYTTEVGMKFGGQPFWHHVECFVKMRGDYNYYLGGSDLPGFFDLSPADQKIVSKTIQAIKITPSQAKKLKAEPRDKDEVKAESALEELIAKQTKQLFKVRDAIQPLTNKADLQNILFANNSGMVEGVDSLLERCSDFLSFGALKKCKKCKNGDMIFAKYGYKCNNSIDEWTMCENFEEKPERVKCKIPREIKDRYKKAKTENFFTKYKSMVADRAVRPQIKKEIKKADEENKRMFKLEREKEPLYGMHVVIIGHTKAPKEDLKSKIQRLGGKLVTKLQEKIAFVISNDEEIEKMNMRMQEVKSNSIQVVPESFLDDVKNCKREETIEKIKSMSICDWGSDPLMRIPQEEEKTERESIYSRSKKKTATMKLKNGTAIDPATGLEEVAHVYNDKLNKRLYSTVLSYTDIQKNKNSFYKMQVLESDAGKTYYLWKQWGRIGTSIGDSKLDRYPSVDDAIEEFEKAFEEKTGNIFGMPFTKQPKKYVLVEVDYENDDKNSKKEELEQIPSKLPKPVQNLIKLIFDIDTMKKALMEFELDLEKMPLGRLSSKQLHEAYSTLNDLDELIKSGENDEIKFIGMSNKFFSLVPHSFGMKKAPIINTVEAIKQKREMIDSLLEIEIAYSMIKDDDNDNSDLNPVDSHYAKLKTDIKPLEKDTEEFKLIESYIQNTHAETHNQYTLEIEDVFKVKRENELRRYKPFKKLHNRQLLWHGSRLTNYVGILSHGLKIAPPDAPCSGYMFGKGVYFADMVSKSANYCCTSPQQPTGLMLLSEVALGDMHELTHAKYITKLPPGKHSRKGIGKTAPNQEQFVVKNGVTIPCGKPTTNDKVRSELLYNEYIVYDVAQINIQYLLKLKFNYKRR